jgi:hypothetical protein
VWIEVLRQQKRRIERLWSKIKVCEICTDFIERNSLFNPPHIIEYHAVKISEELAVVYSVGIFPIHGGHGEFVTPCLFSNGSLRMLDSIQMAVIPEDMLEDDQIYE